MQAFIHIQILYDRALWQEVSSHNDSVVPQWKQSTPCQLGRTEKKNIVFIILLIPRNDLKQRNYSESSCSNDSDSKQPFNYRSINKK